MTSFPKRLSRRSWLKGLAALIGAAFTAPALALRAPPAHKLAKAAVHYQDHPNGRKMCGMCIHFIPPGGSAGHGMMGHKGPGMMGMMGGRGAMMKAGTCQLVQGRIAPMGYCILYAPVSS